MTNDYNFKIVRDPLYGFIGISKEEHDLMNTKVFLRLHKIKQLSHEYVVYPSAIHTRYEHSIGVMHVAGLMCDMLELSKEQKRHARISALLHDIGHGPFSHLYEEVLSPENNNMKKIHEKISAKFMENDSEINDILGSDRKAIIGILQGKKSQTAERTILREIVTGNIDADKLDYLRRDSYHIGAAYGNFDLGRILHTLKIPEDRQIVAIDVKGVEAIESYRLARYLMHAQVYKHHTRVSADQMFLRALHAAKEEGAIDKSYLKLDHAEFLEKYVKMNDNAIYELILKNQNAKISKNILEKIEARKLFKVVLSLDSTEIQDNSYKLDEMLNDGTVRNEISTEIAKNASVDPHKIIMHKVDMPIKLYQSNDIHYVKNGRVLEIGRISPISAKNKITKLYVFAEVHNDEERQRIRDMARRAIDV